MKKYYYGTRQKGPYFEGWYLKYRAQDGKSLALIPAVHIGPQGRSTASLQVITESESRFLEYPINQFRASEKHFHIEMGQNVFNEGGIQLHIEHDGLSLKGSVLHGPFTPPKSDIMGPFRLFPAMECVHSVISLKHSLGGALVLNGQTLDFSGGTGYIEGDRGCSFPKVYLWTQCSWRDPEPGSLMLSIANVPISKRSFTGCICSLLCKGKEYRLATYRGAVVKSWSSEGAVICQGKYRLELDVVRSQGHSLKAPINGAMDRIIRESLSSTVHFRLWHGDTIISEHTDAHAGFEYSESEP